MNMPNYVAGIFDRYFAIFNNAPIGICLTEIDGTISFNSTFCQMLGYTREEILENGWNSITVKDDIEKYHELLDIFNHTPNEAKVTNKRFLHKNGSVIHTEVTSKVKIGDDGRPEFMVSMVKDLTNLHQLKNEIGLEQTKYQQIFDHNPHPMFIYDVDTLKFLKVNQAAVNAYGYSESEFLNRTLNDIRLEADSSELMDKIVGYNEGIKESRTWRHRKKDGDIILVKISSQKIALNGNNARVVMVLDMTEKIEDKRKLVTEVAKLKSIMESTSDQIFSVDTKFCYTSFNQTHSETMKLIYGADIKTGGCLLDYQTSSVDKLKAKENIEKALLGEWHTEISILGDNEHTKKYFEVTYNPIKNDNNAVIGVSVFARDITEAKSTLEQLANREKEFYTLISEDLTADFISTSDGKILLCNPKFLEIFGYNSEEEVYSINAVELYKNASDRQLLIDSVTKNTKVQNVELEMKRRDGRIIIVRENLFAQFDEKGNIQKLFGYILDITEQKAAFEKVNQLSKAIEQSPVTILTTDLDGNINYINKKGLESTGFIFEEVVGKNPRIFSSNEKTNDEYKILWETILAGNEWEGEFHNRKKNGELYWEKARIAPINNSENKLIGFLGIKEDITENKKAEEALRIAREKVDEVHKIKSIFFSNMSHELRTPLVGILGFADILSNTLPDENNREMAKSILSGGKRLLNTLTSIMNLAELENFKRDIELECIDVHTICSEVINHFIVNSNNSDVSLVSEFVDRSLELNVNTRLIREILMQVVNNAVTYTEAGEVKLKTYKKLSGSGQYYGVIEVSDTGIGIPAEKLSVVFEEFRQVSEGFGRNHEGTGLGLTLSKKYVELMDGKIELESEVGKGTIARILIPINDIVEHIVSTESTTAKNNAIDEAVKENEPSLKYSILVVENDDINQAFLEKCLGKEYNLKLAVSGPEALAKAAEGEFDMILMDIGLGKEMDGVTAMKMIRKFKYYDKKPIVAMTAYVENEEKESFINQGFSHHLPKPFLKDDLLKFIKNILIN